MPEEKKNITAGSKMFFIAGLFFEKKGAKQVPANAKIC
jgi:hypothetical protein